MRLSRSILALGAAVVALQPIAAQAAALQEVAPADEGAVQPAPEPEVLPPASAETPSVEGDETAAAPEQLAEAEFAGPFQPQDELERSLWLQMDEYERDLKTSATVIQDEALNAYVRGILCRTVGEEKCSGVRLYIMRSPHFNATMSPNGMMTVWSGLLLRTQNEAQLAAVLGHEFAHFEERHGLQMWREAKSKSNAAAWLAFTGVGLLFSIGLYNSLFKFSREQEEEADINGLTMMANAGYDTAEAAKIWQQLLDEQDATYDARGRKKKKRDGKPGMFDSHPPSESRVEYLQTASADMPGVSGTTGEAEYQAAMRQWWPMFLDDQLKMNDHGGSQFLIDAMGGANGWTPWLTYARAEFHRRRAQDGDFAAAVDLYSEAITSGADLPELWRGRGYALRKLGRKDEARPDFVEYLNRVPDAPDRAMISMLAGVVE